MSKEMTDETWDLNMSVNKVNDSHTESTTSCTGTFENFAAENCGNTTGQFDAETDIRKVNENIIANSNTSRLSDVEKSHTQSENCNISSFDAGNMPKLFISREADGSFSCDTKPGSKGDNTSPCVDAKSSDKCTKTAAMNFDKNFEMPVFADEREKSDFMQTALALVSESIESNLQPVDLSSSPPKSRKRKAKRTSTKGLQETNTNNSGHLLDSTTSMLNEVQENSAELNNKMARKNLVPGFDTRMLKTTDDNDLRFLKNWRDKSEEEMVSASMDLQSLSTLASTTKDYTVTGGDMPFTCNICQVTTATQGAMKVHLLSHTDKQFKCELCEFTACKLSDLAKHKTSHRGQKPFVCQVCGFSTRRPEYLRSHIMKHTGEKPHKCDRCEYSTTRYSYLKAHIACKHSKMEESTFTVKDSMEDMQEADASNNQGPGDVNTSLTEGQAEEEKLDHDIEKEDDKEVDISSFSFEKDEEEASSLLPADDISVEKAEENVHKFYNESEEPIVKHCATASYTRAKDKDRPYQCTVEDCDFTTAWISSMKSHIMKHTGEKPFRCEKCDFATTKSNTLKRHQMRHTGEKPFICDLCDFKCTRVGYLKEHMYIHTGETPYKCEICDFKTAKAKSYKSHMAKHTGYKPHKCHLCDYSATQKGHLREHMKTHTGEKTYSCELCDFKTAFAGSIKVHVMRHKGERPFKCAYCDFSCTQSSTLTVHKMKHTGEKPYQCDFCDFCTTNTGNLRVHRMKHTGERPHQCEVCDFSTTHSSHLKIHMRKHTGEKPYKCELCDFAGVQMCDLKKHMMQHTGVKPYKCEFCEFSTIQSSNLKHHMLTHTGQKPHQCDVCGFSTANASNLRRHREGHFKASASEQIPLV